jgi:L-alanine-DL-glutamate epimerase-like enolase superfamily enzyme
MRLTISPFTVYKQFALRISRGIASENTNLWLQLEQDGIEGWGEASPFSVEAEDRVEAGELMDEFEAIVGKLEQFHPLEQQKIEMFLKEAGISSALRAAIDVALYDWLGKRVGLPLWKLWGLDRDRISPISVTIGINSPQGALDRLHHWQKLLEVQVIKIKLGNPEGIEADQAMFKAIREQAPQATIMVDANGGWTLKQAIAMADWLATHQVKYIEQPLPIGKEDELPELFVRSPLPIFVDESCFSSRDIANLAGCVHGVNLKLMKAGGLSEMRRAIATARSGGLQVMFGCYSDSTLANTALAHLAPLADYLDLDSHLNLSEDPFIGVILDKGRLIPNDLPGLGVQARVSYP